MYAAIIVHVDAEILQFDVTIFKIFTEGIQVIIIT